MEIIKENSFAKAEYDAGSSVIYSSYSGAVNIEKALEVLEAQLVFASKNNVRAIHANLSKLTGTFTMINEWLEKNFFPPMIEKGMECHALIVSSDIFSQFAINDLVQRIGSFELQTFGDYMKGKDWILEKLGSVAAES
ncbi:MAG: hypothetical protein AAGG59_14670 [Bacteroidota bacterium]